MKKILCLCVVLLVSLGGRPGVAADSATGQPPLARQIFVSSSVQQPLTLGVAELLEFPAQQISEVQLICQSGANRGKLENLKGVLLRDVLTRAQVLAPGHNDVKKMIVVASATDGYTVVFSWSEIFNSPVGDGVIVFFEKDGAPLADNEGPIALVSRLDTRTGPRHVRWLKSIEVRKVAD
jgi:DMSO/TMAO reductase YedYZ molybdopterin-dependent catalytic subunit